MAEGEEWWSEDDEEEEDEEEGEGFWMRVRRWDTESIINVTFVLDTILNKILEVQLLTYLLNGIKKKIEDKRKAINLYKKEQLVLLVAVIVEILEMNPEDEDEENEATVDLTNVEIDLQLNMIRAMEILTVKKLGFNSEDMMDMVNMVETNEANADLDLQRKSKCVILKTSTCETIFLPVVRLVDPNKLKPGDLVGVDIESYIIYEILPPEYDSSVNAMEVLEKPTEDYSDIGGLEKQIQELDEVIVLPITHKDRFQKLRIHPPRGVLLYGPPGTGKTLVARACAAQTNATFLKLAGTQLVQMPAGQGSELVRHAFEFAKEKSPCIIFIDEIDGIGRKRFGSESSGDREVQATMLELLNQLDGFSSDKIKVIAATNRVDLLDPALMRSGHFDRKIEFPHPSEEGRAHILRIHSRKMNVHPDVNFEELAQSTSDFNGAQLKAVCVEAGMLALRRDATELIHEDFNEGLLQVQAKKQSSLGYFS